MSQYRLKPTDKCAACKRLSGAVLSPGNPRFADGYAAACANLCTCGGATATVTASTPETVEAVRLIHDHIWWAHPGATGTVTAKAGDWLVIDKSKQMHIDQQRFMGDGEFTSKYEPVHDLKAAADRQMEKNRDYYAGLQYLPTCICSTHMNDLTQPKGHLDNCPSRMAHEKDMDDLRARFNMRFTRPLGAGCVPICTCTEPPPESNIMHYSDTCPLHGAGRKG